VIQFNRKFDPREKKLSIFDLDGTLIDSRQDLINSVNATLRHFERPELPSEVITAYVGDGPSMLVRRALGDPKDKCLLREATDFFLAVYSVHRLDCTRTFLARTFALLCQPFRPFHKGLEEFSGVCIQSGVAENPFLPGRLT
jgi:phosphoglycolate phosphatase-like HAD superfamily hydrolase